MHSRHAFALGAVVLASIVALTGAQQKNLGYDDTPMQPNGKWHIHDGARPQPKVVTPGAVNGSGVSAAPPSDAIVLLGPGRDLSKWQMTDGSPATWVMDGGVVESGKGYIQTRDQFTDFQLHVEWAAPAKVSGDSQGRGNSGVFLLGKFEVQVLDSFENPTYPDGQAAALYGQFPPLVNASRRPGEWQTYDIVFTAPRFRDGKPDAPAVATVFHNGIVVHHATPFWGPTAHKQILPYTADLAKGPIALQDHSNPVRFRNIWIRPANVRES
jgi:3-keto-disaccharide hydrolase